jgi:hypothetical protein
MKTDTEALTIIAVMISGISIIDLTKAEFGIAKVLEDKGLLKVFDNGFEKEYRRP